MTDKPQKYSLLLWRDEGHVIKRVELELTDTALQALCEEMDGIDGWVKWLIDGDIEGLAGAVEGVAEQMRRRDMAEDERT